MLIVGAGASGLRAAETLRAKGFGGQITIVGDEPHRPYHRPAVSEQVLTGDPAAAGVDLPVPASLAEVAWLLGDPVRTASMAAGTATTARGRVLSWDGLVIASGLVPARLDVPGPAAGRFVLRTLDEGRRLARALRPGRRVVVVGAGFLGCEAAVAARSRGCEVTVTALDPEPLAAQLGPAVGAALRRRQEAAGIRFALGTPVAALEGSGGVAAVVLQDGTRLPADLVIEAVGSRPAVDWLASTDLDLADGVRADGFLRALDRTGRPVGAVVVVGDLARYPNPRLDAVPRRIEHWTNATDTARVGGATLAAIMAGAEPAATATPLPSFWSDLGPLRLQAFGWPALGTAAVLEGALDEEAVVGYRDGDGRLVGLLGIGMLDRLMARRAGIGQPA